MSSRKHQEEDDRAAKDKKEQNWDETWPKSSIQSPNVASEMVLEKKQEKLVSSG